MKKDLLSILILYIVGYLFLLYLYNNNIFSFDYISSFSQDYNYLAIIVFVLLFIFGMVMLLPIAILFLFTSGIIWGPLVGTIVSTISTTVAASLAFFLIRHFSESKIFSKIHLTVKDKLRLNFGERNQIKYIILTTLNPFLPQGILNYAYGLTSVRYKNFLIAITIVSLIINFFYVLLGSSLKVIVIEGSLKAGIIYFGIAITAITIIYLFRDTNFVKNNE